MSALILPDSSLIEDLISINPIVDAGYDVHMTHRGGSIIKDGKRVIPISRSGQKFTIDMKKLLRCLVVNTASYKEVMELHRRLGHPSLDTMINAISSLSWINSGITAQSIRSAFKNHPCGVCVMAKRNRAPIPRSINDPKTVPIGHLVSGDIIGPITPHAKDGSKYFFLFVDRRTSYYHVFTSKTKDGFITSLKHVYDFYLAHGHKIMNFRSDSEEIMVHGAVEEYLASNGIIQQLSLPYEHHQNLVERHVQTVVKAVTAVMHDQVLLAAMFWDYALFHMILILNNTPNSKTNALTPGMMVTNSSALDLKRSFLYPFGSPVAVRKPKREWRFDIKNELAVYLGDPIESVRGALVYYPSTGAIVARGDITPLVISPEAFSRYESARSSLKDPSGTNDLIIQTHEDHDGQILDEVNQPSSTEEKISALDEVSLPSPAENRPIVLNNEVSHPSSTKGRIISNRQIKRFIRNITTRSSRKLSALMANAIHSHVDELTSALTGEERNEWIAALTVEMNSLLNITSTLVPEEPDPNQPYDVIYATVVLKRKMLDAVTIDKYKVRICACGNQLINKPGYNNPTYSPTVSMLVHSALLQLSIHDNMFTATYDTVGAYLYQEYPKDAKLLYIKFPSSVARACNLDPSQLYRVRKYLYGLPDSGRAYYEAYSKHLLENGYKRSSSDPCLFIKIDPTIHLRTYAWFHVDDTFVSSTHKEELKIFEEILKKKFQITANYNVSTHLGINITKNQDGSIKLTQPKLLNQLLTEYPTAVSNLYPSRKTRSSDSTQTETEPIERNKYLRLLGQLMYLANTRPDILPTLSYASTRSTEPKQKDYDRLLETVSYLRQTQNEGLTLYPSTDGDHQIHLIAYVDAAYMSHSDAASHTGYTVSIGPKNPKSFFFSKSFKQKLVATSSTHAEIRALYDLTIQLIFIINLFEELARPLTLPAILYEDNQPTIDLATNSISHINKSKHYLMTIQYLREQVQSGLIQLKKIPTQKNIANVLTKIISAPEFFSSFHKIMGIDYNNTDT